MVDLIKIFVLISTLSGLAVTYLITGSLLWAAAVGIIGGILVIFVGSIGNLLK
jgi:uncharacterized membrane protein